MSGTCGLLSPDVPYGQVIVSDGSYRDGAAFLLDKDATAQISRPDAALTAQITKSAAERKLPLAHAIGFTMPIYYFQPGSILRDLLAISGPKSRGLSKWRKRRSFLPSRPDGNPGRQHRRSLRTASKARDGKLAQRFWSGDLDTLELAAFDAAVHALTDKAP